LAKFRKNFERSEKIFLGFRQAERCTPPLRDCVQRINTCFLHSLHEKGLTLPANREILVLCPSLRWINLTPTAPTPTPTTCFGSLRNAWNSCAEKSAKWLRPNRYHQKVSGKIQHFISNALWKSAYQLYDAPFDVRLTRFSKLKNKEVTTVIQPDLCVICDPQKLDEHGCNVAPDLIIEILSPGNSRTEMRDKFDLYQEAGVFEYWIVSPIEKTIQVWKLNEQSRYIGLPPTVEGDLLTAPIVPNLELDVTEVFLD
jgi:Uma2 family endonuclease